MCEQGTLAGRSIMRGLLLIAILFVMTALMFTPSCTGQVSNPVSEAVKRKRAERLANSVQGSAEERAAQLKAMRKQQQEDGKVQSSFASTIDLHD